MGSTSGARNLSQFYQPPRSTQPGHSSVGRRNEYRPKGGDAPRLKVKADMVLFVGNTVWSISERVRSVSVDALYKSTYTLLIIIIIWWQKHWDQSERCLFRCVLLYEHDPHYTVDVLSGRHNPDSHPRRQKEQSATMAQTGTFALYTVNTTLLTLTVHSQPTSRGMARWQERRSWSANFHCRTLDLQLMGDHLCG